MHAYTHCAFVVSFFVFDVTLLHIILYADMRVATDLLTEAFFRNHTNFITYPWEWCFTFLSLEGDFPQPPTQQLHRLPHDILIAEYVLVPKDRIANPIDTSTDRTQTILPSRSTQDDVVVVEAVGMVQLDGRRGRIPWKTQPPSQHQLKSPHLDPDLLSSSTTSIGPQFVISPQDNERPVYLCNLAVRESWRRRGIATQLIQASERLVYQEEPSYQQATHLCLKVRRNTPAVIALYEKLGYAIFQPPPTVPKGPFHKFRIEEESNDEGDNAIWWMAKSLVEDQVETNVTASDAAANQSPHAEVIDQVAKSERSATLPTSVVSSTDVLLGS